MMNRYVDLAIAAGVVILSIVGLGVSHSHVSTMNQSFERFDTPIQEGNNLYQARFNDHCIGQLRISHTYEGEPSLYGKGMIGGPEEKPWHLSFSLKFNALYQLYAGELELLTPENQQALQVKLTSVRPIQTQFNFTREEKTRLHHLEMEGPLWLLRDENRNQPYFASGLPLHSTIHPHLTSWWRDSGVSLRKGGQECTRQESPPVASLINDIFSPLLTSETTLECQGHPCIVGQHFFPGEKG